jgi:GNAT superfamily N-acetyltransferase
LGAPFQNRRVRDAPCAANRHKNQVFFVRDRKFALVRVESQEHRDAARQLITEYLLWIADIAKSEYGLSFDIEAMVESDIEDRSKFYPPNGRFYLIESAARFSGVGCLKRLAPGLGEVQRMYIQDHLRGIGAGRALIETLLSDATDLGYRTVRLESLKALKAAHTLYHSVGFVDTIPYSDNSMSAYQEKQNLQSYQQSAVFMEWSAQDHKAHRVRLGRTVSE